MLYLVALLMPKGSAPCRMDFSRDDELSHNPSANISHSVFGTRAINFKIILISKNYLFAKSQATTLNKLLVGSLVLMINQYVLFSLFHQNSEHL